MDSEQMDYENLTPAQIKAACNSFIEKIKGRIDGVHEDKARRIGEILEDNAKLLKKYPNRSKSGAGLTAEETDFICNAILEPQNDLDDAIQDIIGNAHTLVDLDELGQLLMDCLHVVIACFTRVFHNKTTRHDYLFLKVLFPRLRMATDLVRLVEDVETDPEMQDSPRSETMGAESPEPVVTELGS